MEFLVLLVIAVVVLAIGIRVGILLAPRVERMADRANRFDAVPDAAADADTPAEPTHEDDHDRTD